MQILHTEVVTICVYSVYLSSYIKLYIKWILLYFERIMPDY